MNTEISIVDSFEEIVFPNTEKRSVFVVAEEVAGNLFLSELEPRIQTSGLPYTILKVPGGETIKTEKGFLSIAKALDEAKIEQDGLLLALGGGALLDVAGFVASVYLRGISWQSIPTTLLAMTDTCIGGKTAINAFGGKNRLGTIYPAEKTHIVVRCLASLPDPELINGIAEILKHALIANRSRFEELEQERTLFFHRNLPYLRKILENSLAIKQSIVRIDPRETGPRRLLNFGHTVGHAIEACSEYRIPHGKAVGIGLAVETFVSCEEGFLPETEARRIVKTLQKFGLANTTEGLSLPEWKPFLEKDKKRKGEESRFVMLRSIGVPEEAEGEYCKTISDASLEKAWERYVLSVKTLTEKSRLSV